MAKKPAVTKTADVATTEEKVVKLTKKQEAEAAAKAALAAEAEAKAKEADAKGKGKGKGKGKEVAPPAEPVADAPAVDEAEEEVNHKANSGKPRSLSAITKAIGKKILASAKASVEIGSLLLEGKLAFEYKHSKGATKLFLEWAVTEFGIGKAQAYNYLKIAGVFGSEEMQEKFATVPMMVLSRLTANDAMLDAAQAAIEEGEKVDVKWMNVWLESQKEESEPDTSGKGKGKGKGETDTDSNEEEEETESDSRNQKRIDQDEAFVAGLEAEIEALKAKLESSASGVVSADHFSAVAKRMSKLEPYQVLGVAPDADKKAVKAAMRDMTKLYHPDIVGAAGAEVVEMVEAAAKAMTK
jgi:hypothetical protein